MKLEKSTLLKENERLLNKKEQAKMVLKEKSFVVNRINNKKEELKLEKSTLLKENESCSIRKSKLNWI